ncbi:MAG: hypothetical protein OEM52_04460 [bacterium]|nr:hypothetical protein [bacterium]
MNTIGNALNGENRVIPPGPFFITLEENSAVSHRIVIPALLRRGLLPVNEQPELIWLRNDKVNALQLHPAPVLYAILEERIAELPEEERPLRRRQWYRDFYVIEVNKDYRLTLPKLADLPTSYAWDNCLRAVIVGFGKYAWLFSEVAYNRYLAGLEPQDSLATTFQEFA